MTLLHPVIREPSRRRKEDAGPLWGTAPIRSIPLFHPVEVAGRRPRHQVQVLEFLSWRGGAVSGLIGPESGYDRVDDGTYEVVAQSEMRLQKSMVGGPIDEVEDHFAVCSS